MANQYLNDHNTIVTIKHERVVTSSCNYYFTKNVNHFYSYLYMHGNTHKYMYIPAAVSSSVSCCSKGALKDSKRSE